MIQCIGKESDHLILVKLDGKIAGQILKVEDGWQYFPKGSKSGGEVMKSLADVKQSLEAE